MNVSLASMKLEGMTNDSLQGIVDFDWVGTVILLAYKDNEITREEMVGLVGRLKAFRVAISLLESQFRYVPQDETYDSLEHLIKHLRENYGHVAASFFEERVKSRQP